MNDTKTILREDQLHPYQQFCVSFLEQHPNALCSWTAAWQDDHHADRHQHFMYDSFDVNRVLIIAPLRVARDTGTPRKVGAS